MSDRKIKLGELTGAIDQYADEAFTAGCEHERARITRAIHAAAVEADKLGTEAFDRGEVEWSNKLYGVANMIRGLAK